MKVVLDCILLERARLTLSSKNHENLVETSKVHWEKEKWYGTEYAVQTFDLDVLGKVSSHVTIGDTDHSLEHSADYYSRVTPTAP